MTVQTSRAFLGEEEYSAQAMGITSLVSAAKPYCRLEIPLHIQGQIPFNTSHIIGHSHRAGTIHSVIQDSQVHILIATI